MSSKRQATTELNHDNWNDDDEPEEIGEFREASKEELQTRVIKKARRKLGGANADGESKVSGIFSKLTGFASAGSSSSSGAQPSASQSSFAFLSNLTKQSETLATPSMASTTNTSTFSFARKTAESTSTTESTSMHSSCKSAEAPQPVPAAVTPAPTKTPVASTLNLSAAEIYEYRYKMLTEKTAEITSKNRQWSDEFKGDLAALNQQFVSFLAGHINDNPCYMIHNVILGYEQHFDGLIAAELAREPTKTMTSRGVSTDSTNTTAEGNEKLSGKRKSPARDSSITSNGHGADVAKRPHTEDSTEASTSATTKPQSATSETFKFGFSKAVTTDTASETATAATFPFASSTAQISADTKGEQFKFGFASTKTDDKTEDKKQIFSFTAENKKQAEAETEPGKGNSLPGSFAGGIKSSSSKPEEAAGSELNVAKKSMSEEKPKTFSFTSKTSSFDFKSAEKPVAEESKKAEVLDTTAAAITEESKKSDGLNSGATTISFTTAKPETTKSLDLAEKKSTFSFAAASTKFAEESATVTDGAKKPFSFTSSKTGFSFTSPKPDSEAAVANKASSFGTSSTGFSFISPKVAPKAEDEKKSEGEKKQPFSFSGGSTSLSFASAAKAETTETDKIDTPKKTFGFGKKLDEEGEKKTYSFPSGDGGFSFTKPAGSGGSGLSAGFAFGKTDDGTKKPFSFGGSSSSSSFSFANCKPPPAAAEAENSTEADEEPPKPEFKEVVEEDAVYTKKCKVYIKKDGKFADHGKGTLFLKPIKDSEKTQLIVRAENSLGTIILNMILSAGLPVQRSQKKDVLLAGLPTPEATKPTPILVRVASTEEADELLATIKEHQK